MKLILALALVLTLTSCSAGGTSSNSENAYISGDGSAAVVNVWASWCSPCRAEAPTLEEFAIKNPDIQFVGILTRDNLTSAQSFVKRFGLTYPTLIDDAVIASFRGSLPANAIPTTIVIDTKGRVAARISGQVTVSTMREVLKKVSGSEVNV